MYRCSIEVFRFVIVGVWPGSLPVEPGEDVAPAPALEEEGGGGGRGTPWGG